MVDSLTLERKKEWRSVKLYAISDLHLDFKANRQALQELPFFTNDWLITGGDLCTKCDDLRFAMDCLSKRFARIFWVPGNHELWSSPRASGAGSACGQEKYLELVAVCREFGVRTPEDPFEKWTGPGGDHWITPLFIPYDYSFKPEHVAPEDAINWAMEAGILCTDEKRIEVTPFESMIAWCRHRFDLSVSRLQSLPEGDPIVLVNHYPLGKDLVRLRRIPRFIIWCGTQLTEQLHRQFPVKVAVSGHLHMRATDFRDGVRFEEVSLGYPRDWDQSRGMAYYFREILPGPVKVPQGDAGPYWRFY